MSTTPFDHDQLDVALFLPVKAIADSYNADPAAQADAYVLMLAWLVRSQINTGNSLSQVLEFVTMHMLDQMRHNQEKAKCKMH